MSVIPTTEYSVVCECQQAEKAGGPRHAAWEKWALEKHHDVPHLTLKYSSTDDFPKLIVLQDAAMMLLEGRTYMEISSHLTQHIEGVASVSCRQSTDMKETVVSVTTPKNTYVLEIRGRVALPPLDPPDA
jgi:hypothetical protein